MTSQPCWAQLCIRFCWLVLSVLLWSDGRSDSHPEGPWTRILATNLQGLAFSNRTHSPKDTPFHSPGVPLLRQSTAPCRCAVCPTRGHSLPGVSLSLPAAHDHAGSHLMVLMWQTRTLPSKPGMKASPQCSSPHLLKMSTTS